MLSAKNAVSLRVMSIKSMQNKTVPWRHGLVGAQPSPCCDPNCSSFRIGKWSSITLMCAHHDQHSPVAISHRIHGTGIFTYVWLIFMVNVRIRVLYIPYMDPLIVLLRFFLGHRNTAFLSFFLRGRPAAVHHVKRSNQLTTTVGFVDGEKKPSKYKNKSNSNEHLETESLMSLMLNSLTQYSFIIFVGPVAPHQTHVNVHVHTCLAEFCRSPPREGT